MGVSYQDYYETLGLNRSATEKDIKSAYRKQARKWHPDLHSGSEKEMAEEKFKQINEAYEVLSDPEKRAKYDRLGANWRDGQEFSPPPDMDGFGFYSATGDNSGFSDFFETLFGGGDPFRRAGRKARRAGPVPGQDVETDIEVTLEEAYHGAERTLRLSMRETCPACEGSGIHGSTFCTRCGGTGSLTESKSLTVKIPAGVHDGSRIRLKGQGGVGENGGSRGDLYLKIRLAPHPVFKVYGSDLETELTLRPEQALLGDRVSVPTLDGTVSMTVPGGTHSGRRLRLKGKGLPHKDGRGDEYVRVRIDIPDYLTEQEKQLYGQLAALRKEV